MTPILSGDMTIWPHPCCRAVGCRCAVPKAADILSGVSTSWTLRPLSTQDEALVAQAMLGNLNWSGEQVTAHDVQTQPQLRHYTELMPQRGDFGIVAEGADEPIGLVWAQYLGAEDPGYGFVDEATPELCLWVAPSSRGFGVGRGLLRALQAKARH
jgi:hypothetical protein